LSKKWFFTFLISRHLAIKIARPQQPLSPAKISPAPKNPEIIRKIGLTKYPRIFPIKTPKPIVNCTWRSNDRKKFP